LFALIKPLAVTTSFDAAYRFSVHFLVPMNYNHQSLIIS